jgi:hypothetical protein
MRSFLFSLVLLCLPHLAMAQENDSQFADYRAYDAYVDKMITTRQWVEFVIHMGGRDEYTAEDLSKIEAQFNQIYPRNFTARTIFREQDLGGNIRREARAYWGGGRYLFFYAILHQRDDFLVVLNFSINTKVEAVMNKF